MSKDIKEFIHYYLGQQFMMTKPAYHAVHEFGLSSDTPFAMSGKFADYFHGDAVSAEVKPILRKLESMSEEEMRELLLHGFGDSKDIVLQEVDEFKFHVNEAKRDNKHGVGIGYAMIKRGKQYHSGSLSFTKLKPEQFHYLLSRGFDLFNLIDEGLAIDKETLK